MTDKKRTGNRFGSVTSSRGTRKPKTTPEEATPKVRGKVIRDGEKKVRTTIDLEKPDYVRMRSVLTRVAMASDRPALHAADMWRALITEADEDPDLVERLAERLKAE